MCVWVCECDAQMQALQNAIAEDASLTRAPLPGPGELAQDILKKNRFLSHLCIRPPTDFK